MSSQSLDLDLVQFDRIDAQLKCWDWPFLHEQREAIAAHWLTLSNGKPDLYDGRVILQFEGRPRTDDPAVFEATYFETSYSAFIAHKVLAPPGDRVRNGFGMAALQSRDGAYLLGVMGPQTFNAGKVYFPAGTPDLDDVRADGSVDLIGSVMRELEEETGLRADEVTHGIDMTGYNRSESAWHAVIGPREIAFMRPMSIGLLAEDARALMLDRIARQSEPELTDIVIVRAASDIDPVRMPPFMQTYLRYAFTR